MTRAKNIAIIAFLFLLPLSLGGQIIQIVPEAFTTFINSLPIASILTSADQFYVRQGGISKQVPFSTIQSAVGGGGGGGGNVSTNGTITVGDCAQWATSTTIQSTAAPCGAGTVTSVAATAPGGLTFSGSPITTSGTLGLNWSGTIPNAQIPSPTPSALGGVESITCPAGQFVNMIAAAPGCSTPAGGGNVSTSGTITSGNCAQWNSTTTLISTGVPCGTGGGGGGTNFGYLNIKTFGAVGDGACHPLSGIYANLAAAQAVYPFVSDLTQCVDWAAIQQAINNSYTTAPLANGNFPVYCPVGNFETSNSLFLDTPTNGMRGSFASWVVGTTYGYQANVTYNGIPWVSAGSGNVGNPPTAFNNFPANMQIVGGGNTPAGYPWASVQISNGTPAVITPLLGGGSLSVVANQPIVFFTQLYQSPNGATPALPTGINAHQIYYVVGASITGSTFQVSATPGGTAVNTSSAGGGHFFASGQVWQVEPVQAGDNFNISISFLGADTMPGSSGCQIHTNSDWTAPAAIIGPGNGNIVKNVALFGQVGSNPGNPGSDNGYRCASLNGLGGPVEAGTANVGPTGWAIMSDNGGAHITKFENVGSFNFYYNDVRMLGTAGGLVDSNSWYNVSYQNACVNIFMAGTQAFINEIYSSNIGEATTNVYSNLSQGIKIHGGNYSTFQGLYGTFAITSVSLGTIGACSQFFACVTATITSPDNNLQSPMCSYSAATANQHQAQWLNAWPNAAGCGYNTFVINTAQWGLIGMYVADYNPFTGVILLGIPKAWAGIYQGTCCGSNLGTEIAAATTLYASEAVIPFFGNNQVDSAHIENVGIPTTLSCFCTQFFGGSRPAELRNVLLDSAAAGFTAFVCCNQNQPAKYLAAFYGQQVIPYINSTVGDTIVDYLNGGSNGSCGDGNCNVMDRVSVATISGTYLEMRHTAGAGNGAGAPTTGSAGNPANPMYDFMNSSIQGSFTPGVPLVNPTTLGQLSGGYYAGGGSGFGGGFWDNGSSLGPFSQYSVGANSIQSDMANVWRTRGWGQTPQWGVRPAPYTNPCILPSQATSLATPPAITFVANLQDFLVVSNGGTSGTYAVGNILTLTGGTFTTAAQVQVTAVTGGQVTAVQLTNNGVYTALPAGPPTTFGSTGGGGTGATFTLGSNDGAVFVNYTIGYPMLWGGHLYHACNFNNADFGSHTTPVGTSANTLAIKSTHQGWSYFQNLTTTNVPNSKWSMDGTSPFIYMSNELLELMFPGLVITLTGTGGCSSTYTGIVQEVHPTAGYVKTVGASADGSAYLPALAASGTTCTGTTVGQASPALVYPY